ncbi:uncharacterized protein NP_4512A [Natronomonas pharaonis DSM 2160]|uniref:DUF7847 domain-containing protein n=1 Tax=Natronomonas pharaonis (strain ATCC 35678 / DSM 2160 / CIP 103997 / JCM 8858 / NBRC 14720 / NCIMB 2260 / Gabara) TaxID=348780 RepID=A0A1U7EYN1_NATPD|nr:hypothetical protein [Natronomonas pharaonis]CAI50347.1 uncharacterized protein NP_4512A [Natronomonas pharaonis DSM 2160]
MSLDIGQALREGASRTVEKNGLTLAAVFAGIALLTTVLFQTLTVGIAEAMLDFVQELSAEEMQEAGMSEAEFEEMTAELEAAAEEFRDTAPLALGLPVGAAAGGLLVLALVHEAARLIAVRVFATDSSDEVTSDLVTDNILLATLNGFIGGIVVWGLIIVGLVFIIIPGIILAVLFYFLRQEIALNDKNFVQAMADSWRITKGHRIEVFLIGFIVVLVSRLEEISSTAVGVVSTPAGAVAAAIVGGLLAAFGTAVVTRAYVQINDDDASDADVDETTDDIEDDPYDAALGPDDLSR